MPSDRATVEVVTGPSPIDLAAIANREHALARQSGGSMLEHAFRAGEALAFVKAQLSHGEWLPWLAGNFDGSERLARMYMQVANRKRVADLEEPSLRKALAAIADKPVEPSPTEVKSGLPVAPFWPELLAVRDAIRAFAGVSPAVLAATVPSRRRRQFARDLRAVGRVLGSVAAHLEGDE